MLYTVTAVNQQGIDGTVTLSNGKTIQTAHPLGQQEGMNPEECVAVGFSTCLHATLHAVLKEQNIQCDSQVDVTVTLQQGNGAYYFDVNLVCRLIGLPIETATQLVDLAYHRCPMAKLMQHGQTITRQVVTQ